MVGPQKRVFSAHQAVLSKSPFFRAACGGSFREATSRCLVLEEDDPLLFRHMLDALYCGEYHPKIKDLDPESDHSKRPEDETLRTAECSTQARLYCLAEKYDMRDMKEQAIEKLELLAPIPLQSLLNIAEEVYANVPPSDKGFRQFFEQQAYDLVVGDMATEPWLLEKVRGGGMLAEDIFRALKRMYDDRKSGSVVRGEWYCNNCDNQNFACGCEQPVQAVVRPPGGKRKKKGRISDFTSLNIQ